MDATRAVGYSRVIRWALAIYPAFEMLVIDPITLYLFRPMNDDEYLKYTESLALIPQVFSQTSMRKTGLVSHKSGVIMPFSSFHENLNKTSSVGNLEDSFNIGYSLHY
jgi:hypothetical protein